MCPHQESKLAGASGSCHIFQWYRGCNGRISLSWNCNRYKVPPAKTQRLKCSRPPPVPCWDWSLAWSQSVSNSWRSEISKSVRIEKVFEPTAQVAKSWIVPLGRRLWIGSVWSQPPKARRGSRPHREPAVGMSLTCQSHQKPPNGGYYSNQYSSPFMTEWVLLQLGHTGTRSIWVPAHVSIWCWVCERNRVTYAMSDWLRGSAAKSMVLRGSKGEESAKMVEEILSWEQKKDRLVGERWLRGKGKKSRTGGKKNESEEGKNINL